MPGFETTFANLLKARFPYIYVESWEEERVIEAIAAVARDAARIRTPRRVYTWSITEGLRADGWEAGEGSRDLGYLVDAIEKCGEPAVFVLKDFHAFLGEKCGEPNHVLLRALRDLVPVLKEQAPPRCVVFLAPELVLPMELEKAVTVLEFDLPTAAEIRQVLRGMIEANQGGGRIVIDLPPDDAERLVKAAVGLTLHEAENAFARAMAEDGRLDARDVDVVLEEKRQIIRKSGVLEFVRTGLDMGNVGGLQNLKRWLEKRNRSWLDAAARYGLPAPKGVLLTGVPGCGKSLVAKAAASLWHLPLLRMDVGRIFTMWIGNSEQNMRSAIRAAEAIAPCILWIDEIEKGFGQGDLDGGTSRRVFGTFLTWMQEKTAPVFVMATANDISRLPPEMLRKGRFDEIFFVDLPTAAERAEIFRLHLSARLVDPRVAGGFPVTDETCRRLAAMTEGWVGAEIEHAVVAALFEAFSEDRAVRPDDFTRVIRDTVPLSVTQAEQIRELREWAAVRAVAATPREARAGYAVFSGAPPADISQARGGRTVEF